MTSPDGLLFHLYGLMERIRHDLAMSRKSGIDDHLSNMLIIENKQYYIYGDVAYPLQAYLQSGFQGSNMDEITQQFNAAMSAGVEKKLHKS